MISVANASWKSDVLQNRSGRAFAGQPGMSAFAFRIFLPAMKRFPLQTLCNFAAAAEHFITGTCSQE
jgi:hypothetical protein